MYNEELSDVYRRSDTNGGPCPFFEEGQEFIVEELGEQPENFPCGWAWNDIHKITLALMSGGNFSQWLQDENTYIACCTDGIRPVVFKVERVEE